MYSPPLLFFHAVDKNLIDAMMRRVDWPALGFPEDTAERLAQLRDQLSKAHEWCFAAERAFGGDRAAVSIWTGALSEIKAALDEDRLAPAEGGDSFCVMADGEKIDRIREVMRGCLEELEALPL